MDDDFCTLDPTKICDNCCKCLEAKDAYRIVRADMHLEDMPMEEEADEDLPEGYNELTRVPLDAEDAFEDGFTFEGEADYEDDSDEEYDNFGKNIPPIEIDPALMAEWEAKLADLDVGEQEMPKLHGIRKKRKP